MIFSLIIKRSAPILLLAAIACGPRAAVPASKPSPVFQTPPSIVAPITYAKTNKMWVISGCPEDGTQVRGADSLEALAGSGVTVWPLSEWEASQKRRTAWLNEMANDPRARPGLFSLMRVGGVPAVKCTMTKDGRRVTDCEQMSGTLTDDINLILEAGMRKIP